jgi:hypothetical protein
MLTILRKLFRFSPKSVKAINYVSSEGIARNAGYIFGKQHPELIPQAKIAAIGITEVSDNKKQKKLNAAVNFLLKLSPTLKPQIQTILLVTERTGEDITPLVLAFIQGMEDSL